MLQKEQIDQGLNLLPFSQELLCPNTVILIPHKMCFTDVPCMEGPRCWKYYSDRLVLIHHHPKHTLIYACAHKQRERERQRQRQRERSLELMQLFFRDNYDKTK